MRKALTALVSATTLALVSLDGAALAQPANTPAAANAVLLKRVSTKTFTGTTAQADRWGTVTINVKVQTTTITSGTRKKVTRKYLDLGGSYTYHTDRSNFIMSQALPLLRQEFLQAQNANVQMISGATYTSQAFLQSLQSALLKAGVKK